jgi:pilus assembly protein CpaC
MMKMIQKKYEFYRILRSLSIVFILILLSVNEPIVIYAADTVSTKPSSHLAMSLSVGKSKVYKIKANVTRVSIGDPLIADVMVVNKHEIYLLGKKSGATNVILWYEDGQTITIDLSIGADTEGLQLLFSQILKNETDIKITPAGDSLVLTGKVSDAMTVQQSIKLAEEFSSKKVINMLSTNDLPQVLIEVKIAEIDKTVADNLGIQISGTNFSFNMLSGAPALGFGATASATTGAGTGLSTSWLQANIQSGVIKILAEPNIMAISGQEGQFLAGGIIFIPIPQTSGTGGGAVITLQQQPYGVGLKFTPTVLGGGKVNLQVQPEVSEVNSQGVVVSANGTTLVLPSITTRKASTTVQLFDGQSFAIAGLIKNNVTSSISMFPGLGNLPIIGALFRSSSFQTNRSELIIVVTPRIVKPLSSMPELPTDKYTEPTQGEFFIGGKLEGAPLKPRNEISEFKK